MIRRKAKREIGDDLQQYQPKGFDDFDMRLGDVMRGERATLGKSLLDVQRELRIKASYIAAIENCDPDAFDTPGFIAGYVRSYSRYLGMDPDRTFQQFCAESGFSTTHGMAAEASSRRYEPKPQKRAVDRDPFTAPSTPFIPAGDSMFSRIEPAAIGSALVLLALIGGIGYGGYAVLNEVQRVQVSPVENTPIVLSDLDPLAGVNRRVEDVVPGAGDAAGVFTPPNDAMDRLYRPQALDVPVLVARDGPISTLDPAEVGTFAQWNTDTAKPAPAGAWHPGTGPGMAPSTPEDLAVAEALTGFGAQEPTATPQVVADPKPGVSLVAVRPAWVRIRAANGTVIFEKILDAGESYDLPQTEEAPTLRAGMSGSLYFQVNGQYYGPAGSGTATIRDVAMSPTALTENYAVADLTADPEAERVIAVAHAEQAVQPADPETAPIR